MKAVAAHALRIEALRDGVVIRDRAVAAMERGVEAGNLRQMRKTRENGADRREIVRLVQRRERDIALKIGEHLVVDQNRTVVIGAAMHDAVTDRDRIDLSARRAARRPRSAAPPATSATSPRVIFAIDQCCCRPAPLARSRGRVPIPSIWPLIWRVSFPAASPQTPGT